ncbi:unnamed protein product [Ceratitis capitata]|uniref:(Mediterranean fruit fly) hypothetical protein n=1 Tax=Ceratitis capitata TaxID=7213 RepID=W8CEB2_CERCA|nr:unnamed protein product [Ceratitis capitata]
MFSISRAIFHTFVTGNRSPTNRPPYSALPSTHTTIFNIVVFHFALDEQLLYKNSNRNMKHQQMYNKKLMAVAAAARRWQKTIKVSPFLVVLVVLMMMMDGCVVYVGGGGVVGVLCIGISRVIRA